MGHQGEEMGRLFLGIFDTPPKPVNLANTSMFLGRGAGRTDNSVAKLVDQEDMLGNFGAIVLAGTFASTCINSFSYSLTQFLTEVGVPQDLV